MCHRRGECSLDARITSDLLRIRQIGNETPAVKEVLPVFVM
jgi:hypothetical protein